MPSHATPRRAAIRRAALSLPIAALLLWDAATIIDQADLVRIPLEQTLGRYNRMFAVFKGWSPKAYAYVVRVRSRERRPGARPVWSEHAVQELFPMPRGESFVRLSILLARDPDALARRLFNVYQSRDPERSVQELRVYHASWPASSEGFLARHDERELVLMARY